jgi:hypothetical protein
LNVAATRATIEVHTVGIAPTNHALRCMARAEMPGVAVVTCLKYVKVRKSLLQEECAGIVGVKLIRARRKVGLDNIDRHYRVPETQSVPRPKGA